MVWALAVVGVAVPLAWLVRGTLEASEGGKTPTVAVIDVVGGLSQWIGEDDMMHVAHLLCSQHSAGMLDQLRSIRASLKAKGASLDQANTHETAGERTAATVQTDVRARISIYREGQWAGDVRGDYHTWTFHLVLTRGLTHGWKVCSASLSNPFA